MRNKVDKCVAIGSGILIVAMFIWSFNYGPDPSKSAARTTHEQLRAMNQRLQKIQEEKWHAEDRRNHPHPRVVRRRAELTRRIGELESQLKRNTLQPKGEVRRRLNELKEDLRRLDE